MSAGVSPQTLMGSIQRSPHKGSGKDQGKGGRKREVGCGIDPWLLGDR